MPVAPPLSRRAALALGTTGGALLVAGCDLPGAGGGDDPGTAPDLDPDAVLVDEVVAAVGSLQEQAAAAGLTLLAELHRQHLTLLDADPDASPAGSASPTAAPATRTSVLRAEAGLTRSLTDAAVRARSGQLARVLAAMAAAVAQRTTVISRSGS